MYKIISTDQQLIFGCSLVVLFLVLLFCVVSLVSLIFPRVIRGFIPFSPR